MWAPGSRRAPSCPSAPLQPPPPAASPRSPLPRPPNRARDPPARPPLLRRSPRGRRRPRLLPLLLRFWILGSGFRVQGSGFRVQGPGFWVFRFSCCVQRDKRLRALHAPIHWAISGVCDQEQGVIKSPGPAPSASASPAAFSVWGLGFGILGLGCGVGGLASGSGSPAASMLSRSGTRFEVRV